MLRVAKSTTTLVLPSAYLATRLTGGSWGNPKPWENDRKNMGKTWEKHGKRRQKLGNHIFFHVNHLWDNDVRIMNTDSHSEVFKWDVGGFCRIYSLVELVGHPQRGQERRASREGGRWSFSRVSFCDFKGWDREMGMLKIRCGCRISSWI